MDNSNLKEIKEPTGQQQNGMHQMQVNQTSLAHQKKFSSQIQSLTNLEPIPHHILVTEEQLSMLKLKEMINQKEQIKVLIN